MKKIAPVSAPMQRSVSASDYDLKNIIDLMRYLLPARSCSDAAGACSRSDPVIPLASSVRL